MNKKGYILLILILLILVIGSFLPYVFLKEAGHYQLDKAKDKIKKLYPDIDGDLLDDNIEKNITFTSTTDPDSDDDFFPDGAEFNYWNKTFNDLRIDHLRPTGDVDGDGQCNILDFDSDGDSVPDGWEIENDLNPWGIDSDLDGRSDRFEFIIFYNDNVKPSKDSDGDQLPDYWENYFSVSLPDADPDGDGITNINEWLNGSDPTIKDERYGFKNTEDELEDSDSDGLTNRLERAIGTMPYNSDTDSDGILDGYEILHWSLPFNEDTDGDNIKDLDEAGKGSSSYMIDSDMDKLTDFEELITDPSVPDSNRNLILDGDEFYANDLDRDGLSNLLELDDSDGYTTDPLDPDTDDDGLNDGYEDRDHDGRRDGNDPTDGNSDWGSGGETDPNDPDTDGGGMGDGEEIRLFRDPLNPEDDVSEESEQRDTPSTPTPTPQRGLYIDPWACLTVLIIIVIIVLVLVVGYYLIYRKRKLIDEIIDILETGERELYQLDTGDEIRNAIYRTYRAFLNALLKYDLERAASMTVQEFAKLVRNKLSIRPAPVAGLTDIFEEARYSNHKMGRPNKNRAIQSFRSVREDLIKYRSEFLKSKESLGDSKPVSKLLYKIKNSLSFKEKKRDIPKNNR